ncbi:MAG: hypothetical protein COV44_09060 [Deltaproteobacteria bacterium CG11_big_fil_rev_8_21_14_0_20_45_16]|nr:MAG: hypothetical protein COV44_09060 [Deltaproteobacteria bacterium CG11_big_fil_rev_8_21_14_0_20_45_16]
MSLESRSVSFFLAGIIFVSFASFASAKTLNIGEYLEKVQQENLDVQASRHRLQSSESLKSQPELMYQPFVDFQLNYSDAKDTGVMSFQSSGAESKTVLFAGALRKDWMTGTHTSINHIIQKKEVEGLANPGEEYWRNSLSLKVEQDLWRNFLGQENRSGTRRIQAELEAMSKQEKFMIQQILIQAEASYWNYALAIESRKSLEDSLKRSSEILEWNRKRLKLNVVDRGDVLQSEAQVLRLQQSLEESKRNEKAALRSMLLNLRNEEGEEREGLEVDSLEIKDLKFEIPESWDEAARSDLEATRSRMRAAEEDSVQTRSSLLPDLNLYASYSGNAAELSLSKAEESTLDNSYRTYEVGVKLSIPLNILGQNEVAVAKRKQALAAAMDFNQKKRSLQSQFLDLRDQIQETLENIKTAQQLKKTESEKLKHEQKRFKQGRSTSFQVLSFEEDLARADLELLRLYALARNLRSQFRLFLGN